MANNFNFPNSVYVETTSVWDTSQIESLDATPEMKDLLVRLYQNLNNMSVAINLKDTGYYDNAQEFVTSSQLFPNPADNSATAQAPDPRPLYRTVVTGVLMNAGTTTIPHNINPNGGFSFLKIYGSATDPVNLVYLPLPYSSVSAVADNIEVYADATNVYIITAIDYSAYTEAIIILEYSKF